MAIKTVEYTNEISFHIRPIGKFTNTVKNHTCEVLVTKDNLTVHGNRAMQLLRLAVVKGDLVTVEVKGENEDDLLEELIGILLGGE